MCDRAFSTREQPCTRALVDASLIGVSPSKKSVFSLTLHDRVSELITPVKSIVHRFTQEFEVQQERLPVTVQHATKLHIGFVRGAGEISRPLAFFVGKHNLSIKKHP